jgi:phage I-like protein
MIAATHIARNAQQSDPAVAVGRNIVLKADGAAPEWIELLPPGRDVQGVDGRAWKNDQPQALVAEFNRVGRPLPLDQDHASDLAASEGRPAPAAGWIEELEVREDGSVWGRVAWTPRGVELVRNREYRYISPAFFYDKASTRILRMVSAALTNQPNLRMTALNRAANPIEDPAMNKELLKALGLIETATEADVLAAVNALKGDLATARNSAAVPSLDKFVPRADYDKELTRANNAETSLKERTAKALDGEIEAEIKAALAAKKITPATAEYHKAQCRQEGGLARFRDFVKAAPVIAEDSRLGDQDPAKGKNSGLTPDQLAVCAAMNLKPEEYAKALA